MLPQRFTDQPCPFHQRHQRKESNHETFHASCIAAARAACLSTRTGIRAKLANCTATTITAGGSCSTLRTGTAAGANRAAGPTCCARSRGASQCATDPGCRAGHIVVRRRRNIRLNIRLIRRLHSRGRRHALRHRAGTRRAVGRPRKVEQYQEPEPHPSRTDTQTFRTQFLTGCIVMPGFALTIIAT